jgi:hypothetical protein
MEFQLGSAEVIQAKAYRHRYAQLLSPQEVSRFVDIQSRILQSRNIGQPLRAMTIEDIATLRDDDQSEWIPYWFSVDVWMPYLDEADVMLWAEFLVSRLPVMVDRFLQMKETDQNSA